MTSPDKKTSWTAEEAFLSPWGKLEARSVEWFPARPSLAVRLAREALKLAVVGLCVLGVIAMIAGMRG